MELLPFKLQKQISYSIVPYFHNNKHVALIYVYIFYLRTFCLQVGIYIYLAKIYYIHTFIVSSSTIENLVAIHSHTGPAGNRLCACYSLLDNAHIFPHKIQEQRQELFFVVPNTWGGSAR